jgi:hypothetical protein
MGERVHPASRLRLPLGRPPGSVAARARGAASGNPAASPASNQPTSSCSPEGQLGPRARGDAQGRDTRGVLSDNGGAYLSTTKFTSTSRSAPDQEEGSESTWLGGEQPRRHQRRRSPPASGASRDIEHAGSRSAQFNRHGIDRFARSPWQNSMCKPPNRPEHHRRHVGTERKDQGGRDQEAHARASIPAVP